MTETPPVLPRRMSTTGRAVPARYRSRVVAAVIDLLLVAVPFLIGVLVEMLAAYDRVRILADGATITTTVVPWWATAFVAAMGLLSIALLVLNTVVAQGRTGRTIGKRVMHLRLESAEEGGPIGVGPAFVRLAVTATAVVLVVPFIIDALVPLGDRDGRRLVDRMLGSVVVPDVVDLRRPVAQTAGFAEDGDVDHYDFDARDFEPIER